MHFAPVSDFPLFSKQFSDSAENVHNFTFSRKFFRFSSAKISDDLSPPYFPCFSTFPSLFRKNYYFSPTFYKFPPCFRKIHVFLYALCIFRFPPTLTMMHLCITQYTYWSHLVVYFQRCHSSVPGLKFHLRNGFGGVSHFQLVSGHEISPRCLSAITALTAL